MSDTLEVLVERIEGLKHLINEKFDENTKANIRIETQVLKTNGRVNSLEIWKQRQAGALIILSALVVPLIVQYLKDKL